MNLNKLLIIISIFSILSCKSTKKFELGKSNCKNFHIGEFIYFNKQENKFDHRARAIRTINQQVYIAPEKGDTLIYDISWISDCKYELTLVETNKEPGPYMVQIGDKLVVEIEPINKISFQYKSKRINSQLNHVATGKMKKIN